MKKILILALVLVTIPAVSAFAATKVGSEATDGVYTVDAQTSAPVTQKFTVQMSKNVQMFYTAPSGGTSYALTTYHTSGTRTYGSSSGDSRIYYAEGTNETCPDAPTGTASAAWTSGTWNAM